MDVSVIIVNYNTCLYTKNCLKSVFEQTKDVEFEVIVSDNGSIDGSIEMIKTEYPQVILIENNANLGFGAANNRALKIAKGKYIFYLNSDTVLLNNAVKLFYDYWENSPQKDKIGALGGNLLDENGNWIHSYGFFPRPLKEIKLFIRKIFVVYIKKICNLLRINYNNLKKEIHYSPVNGKVEYITGADLFVKNNSLAFYDERFFLYYEETDLQWRMENQLLDRIIIDSPKIIHFKGVSNISDRTINMDKYISFGAIQSDLSRIKYIKYNVSKNYAFILKILLFCFWLTPGFCKKTKQYRKLIWKI